MGIFKRRRAVQLPGVKVVAIREEATVCVAFRLARHALLQEVN